MNFLINRSASLRPKDVCVCGVRKQVHDLMPKEKCPGFQERYSMDVHALHPMHDQMLSQEVLEWDGLRKWYHRIWHRIVGKLYCFWCQSGQPVVIVAKNPINRNGPGLYVTVTCKTCGNVIGPMASSFLLEVIRHMEGTKGEFRAMLVARRFMSMTGVNLKD